MAMPAKHAQHANTCHQVESCTMCIHEKLDVIKARYSNYPWIPLKLSIGNKMWNCMSVLLWQINFYFITMRHSFMPHKHFKCKLMRVSLSLSLFHLDRIKFYHLRWNPIQFVSLLKGFHNENWIYRMCKIIDAWLKTFDVHHTHFECEFIAWEKYVGVV